MTRLIAMLLHVGLCALLSVLLGTARASTDLADRLALGGTIIGAHRGWLAPDRPENSLRTMRETEAAGHFMLEMDLAVTADHDIVMMHDPTIDRTTDGTDAVAALQDPAPEATHQRPHREDVTSEAPPFFSDILAWAGHTPQALLMLDIKRTPPDRVMDMVRRAGMTGRVLLLTFDRSTARAAFAVDPDVLVSVLVTDLGELNYYRGLAAGRRFAAYVPLDRPVSLFEQARTTHEPVVTDLLDLRNALFERYPVEALRQRPVDIVVTNHPMQTAAWLSGLSQGVHARSK